MEIRKDVQGYEGRYMVSNQGRVYSILKDEMKISRVKGKGQMYQKIDLFDKKDGYRRNVTTYLHRLVAYHFLPNPENKLCVNHIN